MDIKKEFNRLQALISGYALDNPEIDYLPISKRVELIAKEVELKLAELDEVREEYIDYLMNHLC